MRSAKASATELSRHLIDRAESPEILGVDGKQRARTAG